MHHEHETKTKNVAETLSLSARVQIKQMIAQHAHGGAVSEGDVVLNEAVIKVSGKPTQRTLANLGDTCTLRQAGLECTLAEPEEHPAAHRLRASAHARLGYTLKGDVTSNALLNVDNAPPHMPLLLGSL